MNTEYIAAIEKRLEWLAWGQRNGLDSWERMGYGGWKINGFNHSLEHGETFYMDPHFCRLVDHARRTAPDDMVFDPAWLVRPAGWMWMAEPAEMPLINWINQASPDVLDMLGPDWRPTVAAVGWHAIPPGSRIAVETHGSAEQPTVEHPHYVAGDGCTHFQFYLDFRSVRPDLAGFGAWSYFVLQPGQRLGDRIEVFERNRPQGDDGQYFGPNRLLLHEMRWLYAALKLSSQRLATRVRHNTDRATKRRAERNQQAAPPFLEVITLRRLEAARPRTEPEAREWQWQWEVRGHWRNQWYAKERVHRQKFIEAYIKGDATKPFKEHGTKLFVASR